MISIRSETQFTQGIRSLRALSMLVYCQFPIEINDHEGGVKLDIKILYAIA